MDGAAARGAQPGAGGLVKRAEDRRWSSLRCSGGLEPVPPWMDPQWLERPADWLATVNAAQDEKELSAVRRSVIRGAPFGEEGWMKRTARSLGLESALRPRGRPRKEDASNAKQTKK